MQALDPSVEEYLLSGPVAVVGLAVHQGLAVVGAAVIGFAVTGAAVVGLAVHGAAVVGLAVTGAAVVGLAVTGAAVVGTGVAVRQSNRTNSARRSG
jgi:hypothetical protein